MVFKTRNDGRVFNTDNNGSQRSSSSIGKSSGVKINSGVKSEGLPNGVAMPDKSWKEKDFQQTKTGLGKSENLGDFKKKGFKDEIIDVVPQTDINIWANLTFKERGDVLKEALGVDKKDVSFYEITVGIRGLSKNERVKVIESAKNISPEQHEWDLLDSIEEDLQIHGDIPFHFQDDVDRLPKEDQKFINDAKGSFDPATEKIRRVKQMKFKLLGKTRNESNPLRDDVFRVKIEGFD